MNFTLRGPWDSEQIDDFLEPARYPLRLACVAEDGFPRVASLWYRYKDGDFYCVTHQASKIAALLRSNDRVGFEVSPNEPPYQGVRGQGVATLDALGNGSLLHELLDNYLGGTESDLGSWLLARSEEELVVKIHATRLYTWDYRERMSKSA
jgi:hypothetical protein